MRSLMRSSRVARRASPLVRRLASESKKKRVVSSFGPGPRGKGDVDFPTLACWSCDQVFNPKNELFCNSCSKLQPQLAEKTYFELFDLPVSLRVDPSKLERKFQFLQKSIHPDMYASKSPEEQEIAKSRSATASEAYSTLKNPIHCAKYVLGMKGVDLESHKLDDQGLLMEIMEEQEALQDADGKQLREKADAFSRLSARCLNDAEKLLQDHGDGALEPITSLVIRAQYYDKLAKDAYELSS